MILQCAPCVDDELEGLFIAGAYYLAKFIGDKCNVYDFLRSVSGVCREDHKICGGISVIDPRV